jgi:hypothetical protein
MKTIIKSILFAVFFTSFLANAQSFGEELTVLQSQNFEWFKTNTPNLLKKTPYNIQAVTAEQLSDSSMPSQQEIVEITKTIVQRNWYQSQYSIITKKYIKPLKAAQELIDVNEVLLNSYNQATTKLVSGEITYGEYNKVKQKIIEKNVTDVKKIANKYGLSK